MSLVSRLRELLAEGVPLPWEAPAHREDEDGYSAAIYGNVPEDEQGVADVIRPQDAALIVAAVNALPKLLDVVEAARKVQDYGHVEYCHAISGPPGETWYEEDQCSCGLRELRAALSETAP
jgi:hypothetical protein